MSQPFKATNAAYISDYGAVLEGLAALGTPSQAESTFARLTSQLDGCRVVTIQEPNGTASPFTGTLVRANFAASDPALGDESAVWHLSFGDTQTANAGSGEYLIVRRGSELMLLGYLGQGFGQVEDILSFADSAIAKMRG